MRGGVHATRVRPPTFSSSSALFWASTCCVFVAISAIVEPMPAIMAFCATVLSEDKVSANVFISSRLRLTPSLLSSNSGVASTFSARRRRALFAERADVCAARPASTVRVRGVRGQRER